MNRRDEPRTIAQTQRLLVIAVLFGLGATAAADVPSGGGYVLRKQVIAAGGSTSSGGDYRLTATLAQPAAGVIAGGSYVLQQGFHAAAVAAPAPLIFKDNFELAD